MANKEIQLHDANGDNLIPVTCMSSIFVLNEDNTTQSLESYINALINKAVADAEKNTLTTLGASVDGNKVSFSKTITSSSVEGAVWNS